MRARFTQLHIEEDQLTRLRADLHTLEVEAFRTKEELGATRTALQASRQSNW